MVTIVDRSCILKTGISETNKEVLLATSTFHIQDRVHHYEIIKGSAVVGSNSSSLSIPLGPGSRFLEAEGGGDVNFTPAGGGLILFSSSSILQNATVCGFVYHGASVR